MDELASHMSEHIGRYFKSHQARLETLASDRPPTILFIGCVDARVIPELMLNVDPGDMMTIRVPGALVPPQGLGDVCVAGSVELVLSGLPSIKHIVVCGHTSCAFNARLVEGVDSYHLSHLARLMAMADFAQAQASTKVDKNTDPDGYLQTFLEFTIQRSIQALRELEIVKQKEKSGDITLHGWYFNLTTGQIMVFDEKKGAFEPADPTTVESTPVAAAESTAQPVASPQTQPTPQVVAQTKPSAQQPTPPQSETSSAVPSVAPPPVAAAHQATIIDVKAPEPVNVPSAKPVERVYVSEVSRVPTTKSVEKQSPSIPAQQQRPAPSQRPPVSQRPEPSQRPVTPQRPTRQTSAPPRPQQSKSATSRPQPTIGNSGESLQQAADNVQSVLDQQNLRNLGELLQDVSRPAQRMRLRNVLNQVKSPQGWQTVRNMVGSVQNADVRQALRELSIELASPDARSQLRDIISGLADPSGTTDGADMSKIEQDFLSILNNLRDKE
jgi:carbonic anhydrase